MRVFQLGRAREGPIAGEREANPGEDHGPRTQLLHV